MDVARKKISAEELDRLFDEGADMRPYFNFDNAEALHGPTKRVNVDFPALMVLRLDREAKKRGVTRQALIKMWLADRLEATG
ncbi:MULTISPECIES: type II toxin-antitoxin system BrnA family antitoxin [unclassified Sphingomonas]|jgi:hypothetical protein|uniref:type II toxin-antitoxin system BrnA family antitoxin n=1 Tax=unclassified Sphingomonas TaxID=196159 RepID=UPI000AFC5173|nr:MULTISPECIES: hypothetical protein [unclassified Sphingomonas]